MTDTCEECGRRRLLSDEEYYGDEDRCDRLSYDQEHDADLAEMALIDCQEATIKRLKARVAQLEGELENYDTTDAQNHAVAQVVKSLNRILDEERQVGKFGSPQLQALAERILFYAKGTR